MNIKPILIVTGEPFSIFSEILFKTFRKNKFKKPIIIIGSYNLLCDQMKFLKYRIQFNVVKKDFNHKDLKNNKGPLPAIIEISESGMCNRKCSFCPRSDPGYNHVNEFISFFLLEKLATELNELNYNNRILFSGFVEPLLDKKLYEKIKLLKKYLPNSKIEVNTNGDVLNKKRMLKLFESGLDVILISVYDSKEDADKFEKLCNDTGLNHNQFVIRHRYYSEEKDFGITLSNRAGMMNNADFSIKSLSEPLKSPCYYPSYTFFLDYQSF